MYAQISLLCGCSKWICIPWLLLNLHTTLFFERGQSISRFAIISHDFMTRKSPNEFSLLLLFKEAVFEPRKHIANPPRPWRANLFLSLLLSIPFSNGRMELVRAERETTPPTAFVCERFSDAKCPCSAFFLRAHTHRPAPKSVFTFGRRIIRIIIVIVCVVICMKNTLAWEYVASHSGWIFSFICLWAEATMKTIKKIYDWTGGWRPSQRQHYNAFLPYFTTYMRMQLSCARRSNVVIKVIFLNENVSESGALYNYSRAPWRFTA